MANRNPGLDASISSLNSLDNDTSAASSANIDTQPSKWTSASTSLTASPVQSRDPSPTKQFPNSGRTSRTSTHSRSRKNSQHDTSPARSRSHNPSPSVTPRQQLSSATTPTLPPPTNSGPILRAPVPQKPSVASESSRDAPRWPVSPRLKSPPPNLTRPAVAPSAHKNDSEPPVINVQRATPSPHVEQISQSASDNEVEDSNTASGIRTPVRGSGNGSSSMLETVQEVSQPNTPRPGLDLALEKLEQTAASQRSAQAGTTEAQGSKSTQSSQNATNSESGSDSGSLKTRTRRPSTTAPPPSLHSRQSSSTLRFGKKGQPSGESSSRNMTVETEEVHNIPQLSLVPNVGGQGVSGSLRTRPSAETIKPRKEKKKHNRKPASVAAGNGETPYPLSTAKLRHCCSTRSFSQASCRSPTQTRGQGSWVDEASSSPQQGNRLSTGRTPSITSHVTNLLTRGPRPVSSKADIFEAKVASAVEEADSSDSDETFVYDSNPPDADRPRRYHSRTPSATSMVSQVDRNGMRSIHGVLENGAHNLPIKKNMKFVNTYNSNGNDSLHSNDDGRDTARSNAGSARGTGRHHHHPSRWGRQNGNNHLSLFDNESPFPNAARSKLSGTSSRQPSNPPSPRFNNSSSNNNHRGWMSHNKRQMTVPSGYDLDDTTTGADDERTPLLNTNVARSVRSNRSRRTPLSRNIEAQTYRQAPSFLNRFASCLVLTIMLLLVITGAIGFMFATSQPLTEIELENIGNVLASEQELMMDVTVRAHNPNVVIVMIDSADLEVFAKSPHAGTDSEWWRRPHGEDFDILDDPRDDPPMDDNSPNMRLGNILTLDSPLTYEGSFFQSGVSVSTGELRLAHPGNSTDSGTERWERIISDDFTLIVKGVLKYTLPLSQRVRSVAISGKVAVKPNSVNDPSLQPNRTEIGIN